MGINRKKMEWIKWEIFKQMDLHRRQQIGFFPRMKPETAGRQNRQTNDNIQKGRLIL